MPLKINFLENGTKARSLFFWEMIFVCDFALPEEFTEEQKTALLAVSEFVFDIDWATEKIRKGEYELWDDVKNYKSLGRAVTESLELPDWSYIYFDFEKFGNDLAAERQGMMTSYGWFVFK